LLLVLFPRHLRRCIVTSKKFGSSSTLEMGEKP
jgi:hypothetical protein